MAAALTPSGRVALVGSTAPGHKARGIRTGMKAKRVKGKALRARRAQRGRFVYVVRGGRVQAVAVTTAKRRKARPPVAEDRRPLAPANVNRGWVGSGSDGRGDPAVCHLMSLRESTTLVPPRHLEPAPTQPPFAGALQERLALAAVRRHRRPRARPPRTRCSSLKRSHSSPAFACRIHTRSPTRSSAAPAVHRRLHLARALLPVERQPVRQDGARQPVGARRARRRVAAAEQRRRAVVGPPHDRQREQRRGLGAEARRRRRTASARRAPSPPRPR